MSKRSVFIYLSPSKLLPQPFGPGHTLNSLPKRHNRESIFPSGGVKEKMPGGTAHLHPAVTIAGCGWFGRQKFENSNRRQQVKLRLRF
ncbi:hypothetical protein ACFL1G_00975 [Planctomycetota bacterium]